MKTLQVIVINLILLLAMPTGGLGQNEGIYVWEFTNRDGSRNEYTRSLTEDFEEKLIQSRCCKNILQRRHYARLFDQKEQEKSILSIENIPPTLFDRLKALDAKEVVFGEVFEESSSGQIKITVTVESFNSKILDKASIYLPKYMLVDPFSRREKISELFFMLRYLNEGSAIEGNNNLSKKENSSNISSLALVESEWEGRYNQPNDVPYEMIMSINKVNGSTFFGNLNWPTLGNAITRIEGEILTEDLDFETKSKLRPLQKIIDFDGGLFFRFRETRIRKMDNVAEGEYYCYLYKNGSLIKGIWYENGKSAHFGDFIISK